jgi:hypothetical protein
MRSCIGQSLARMNVPTAVAMLVCAFRFKMDKSVRFPYKLDKLVLFSLTGEVALNGHAGRGDGERGRVLGTLSLKGELALNGHAGRWEGKRRRVLEEESQQWGYSSLNTTVSLPEGKPTLRRD